MNLGEQGDISNNRWWELEPLKYLDLSSNYITEIPKQINELDSLNTLNVSFLVKYVINKNCT